MAPELWHALLSLNQTVKTSNDDICTVAVNPWNLHWSAKEENVRVDVNHAGHSQSFISEQGIFVDTLNPTVQAPLIKVYLDTILANFWAKKKGRCITIGHFAQSLDSKIATNKDHSKWIGNPENQLHAHRMRALCDGIIVGKNTFALDNPSLNVRHVEGPDPQKIIIGRGGSDIEALLKSRSDHIIAVMDQKIEVPSNIDIVTVQCNQAGVINCGDILDALYAQGIQTIYIEGGATTMSHFIEANLLDYLQVHVEPIIFGSGKDAFKLTEIRQVDEAITFQDYNIYEIGRAPMFAGVLNQIN